MSSQFDKEDALRCLEIAKRAAEKGDVSKAEKFAVKAKKLCDCPEVEQFLRELSSRAPPGPSASRPSLRQRPARAQKPQGTEAQRELIARIKRAQNFYETLDVTDEATEDDVKRAYKKLALKLHPDKNTATGAEEAFKAVSRAFSCLSDPEKRRNYDRYGTEERLQNVHAPHHQEFYPDDFDPEQIFNMFFRGAFPMGDGDFMSRPTFYGRRFRRAPQRESARANGTPSNSQMLNLFSLLPLLLFIFFSFFNGREEQLYSIQKTYPYEQEVITQRHAIPFYVKSRSRFGQSFPSGSRERQALEANVEGFVKRYLEEGCREEKRRQKRIRTINGAKAAERYELKSCLDLHKKFYSGSQKTRPIDSH